MLTILWFTVYHRTIRVHTAQLELFWSYKAWLVGDTDLGKEILANIVMFVPFGFLLSFIQRSRRPLVVILSAMLFSFTIETLQLFLMRGLFEWDDLVSNILGACAGLILYQMVSKIPEEKRRTIIYTTIALGIIIFCSVIIILEYKRGGLEEDNTSTEYCFQIDSVEFIDDSIELSGFSFRYQYPVSEYTLLLRSKDGTRIKLETESIARPDVNEYFSCEYDYTLSGYTARGKVDEGEYEVLIKWPWSIALSTRTYISSSGVYYVKEDEFTAPEINADFVDNGILRIYRPDVHCWVYQYEGSLYWIVGRDFNFEDDNTTYIQYQLYTTQEDRLPQKRIENRWLWDNIGGYFEDYEVPGYEPYRVMRRQLPTAYSVTSIVTGYYKNGEWIWKEYFRPYYEF